MPIVEVHPHTQCNALAVRVAIGVCKLQFYLRPRTGAVMQTTLGALERGTLSGVPTPPVQGVYHFTDSGSGALCGSSAGSTGFQTSLVTCITSYSCASCSDDIWSDGSVFAADSN